MCAEAMMTGRIRSRSLRGPAASCAR